MDNASGRMVPARDSDALASALAEVLDRSWNAGTISGQHSRSWSDVSDDVEEILTAVLERSAQLEARI
jgi:hypothetical protein